MGNNIKILIIVHRQITQFLQVYLLPVLLLAIRIWLARIFLYSGLAKLDDWSTTLFLFEYEYKVILFSSVYFTAALVTFCEIFGSICIILGIATRFFALLLLIITLVIQFLYLDIVEHYYWIMLFSLLILHGPSFISIDYFVINKLKNNK